jgi:hypothetical protein
MFKRFSRAFVLAGVGLTLLVPTAGPASAEDPQICYVEVVIDEMPYVTPPQNIGGTTHVGTGEFHTEQNCIGPIKT